MIEQWIPKDLMIVGNRYECDARNFSVGTWNGTNFDYIREKFGDTYPATEDHWDDGVPHGTVKPIRRVIE